MARTSILLTTEGQLATLTLNRPDRLNALTPAMAAEMIEALDESVATGARALLLTGAGRGFCAGADIGVDSGADTLNDFGAPLDAAYNPLVAKLAEYPLPIVTAVNGAAAGAGFALALLGDIVVAARSAYLLLSFARIGIVPDCGATWLAVQSAGLHRAMEMMMLADKIPAELALSWGMINRVVDDTLLLDEASALAGRLASGPTRAYGMIRRAARAAPQASLADILALERDNQRSAGHTKDAREAFAAFVEKRAPVFRGI